MSMYRLLVVDNEHIIVESLLLYFENQTDIELEVYGVLSAMEALKQIERMKIDIMVTDIRMPGMNGLELHQEALRRWPRLKTIFLSGYVDFDYAQQAIRSGGCDYVLKNEGKQAILQAVNKACEQLDAEVESNVLLHQAREQMAETLPLLRQRLLKSVLRSAQAVPDAPQKVFRDLGIPLLPDACVLILLGRRDGQFSEDAWEGEMALHPVKNLVCEYLGMSVRSAAVVYDAVSVAWFLQPVSEQPADNDWERLRLYVSESAEDIRRSCEKLLGSDMSFAISARPVPLQEAAAQRARLEYLLHLEGGAILLEPLQKDEGTNFFDANAREQLDQVRQLAIYLETGCRIEFTHQLSLLCKTIDNCAEPLREDLRTEAICMLSAMIIAQINKLGLKEELARVINLRPLIELTSTLPWEGAVDYMMKVTAALFDIKSHRLSIEESSMVARIHWVIEQNLGGDLSLPRLGEITGMNPYYMARLYQKTTGERLVGYIARKRLEYAQQIIAEGDIIIRDVARAVGFSSEQAFHRFFKKMCGITPHEYREKYKKDKP